MDLTVRAAVAADLEAIRAIYNHAVLHLAATFDTEERSIADRQAWFARHGGPYPLLVAEERGAVLGWAALSPYSERPAYARTVENSVYVHHAHRGRGIGLALMHGLMAAAAAAGHHAVIARITGGNQASVRLHGACGFAEVGTLREVGWKFARWHDVLLMQALLPDGPGATPGAAPAAAQ